MNSKKSNTGDAVDESDDSVSQSDKDKTNGDVLEYTTEVIFSAPFRTDVVLDSKKLLEEYEKFRNEVEKELNCISQFAGWKLDPHIDFSKTSSYGLISPDRPGLTTIAPYFIGYVIRTEDKCSQDTLKHLQKEINDELNSRINKINSNSAEKENKYDFGNNFIVSKAELKFYEFGFGSVTVYVKCKKTEMLDESVLKYAIESDKIKSIFDNFILGYIDKYAESIPKELLQKSQFQPHNNLVESKKVYWTHRLISFILTSEFINSGEAVNTDETSSKNNCSHKDKVSKFYHKKKSLLTQTIAVENIEQVTIDKLQTRKQIFIPGVGNSILLSMSNINLVSDFPEEQKEAELKKYLEEKINNISNMISITGTHSAFVHYFYEDLLYFVNDIIEKSEKEKNKSLNIFSKEMTKLLNDILEKLHIYSHINFLLREYKSFYLSSIGMGAYHKLVEVWEFEKQWNSIEQQIKTLEKIYDRNDQHIDRRQQKTLNIIVFLFTFVAAFTGLGKVSLYKIKFEWFAINSFDSIFVIFCLAALVYLAYRIVAFLLRKFLSKLCNRISSFCKKISAKNGQ